MTPNLKPLKDFSDYGFLRLLVSSPTQKHLVTSLATHGVAATIPEIRRHRKEVLRRTGHVPVGMIPTARDYARIYQTIDTEWKDEDLL